MMVRSTTFLLTVLFGISGCSKETPPAVIDQSVRPAHILQVSTSAGERAYEFVGRVEAAQMIDLKFEVGGRITHLAAREGETVRTGTLVAALDPREFDLAVREAQVQKQLAAQDLERKSALLTKRVVSQSIVDDAKALFDLRQVHLEQASKRLAETEIHAPFDAYVVQRYVDNSVVVQPGDPVARLSDLGELVIAVSIPELLLATVKTADVHSITATFPFIPNEVFPLQYRENRGEADAVAQTYDVTLTMPPPKQWNILPGMTATVRLVLEGEAAASQLLVPAAALTSTADGATAVWVFDPETELVAQRLVLVVPQAAGQYQVMSGLADGEWIVAMGAYQLQPGMRIRPLRKS